MKRCNLQNRVSEIMPKKFYEIDPRLQVSEGSFTLEYCHLENNILSLFFKNLFYYHQIYFATYTDSTELQYPAMRLFKS
jgi:hypothetical protein